ncbi:precorrin-6y C5,15-methyltransferase (decarboxylating) subunit CbiE [Goodfellowiella coeruleoviolacea]|uniref:Precorrin-6Y C5,15-methyltransferase (Decarboxylating) n=1 Tax=Goodfellowiella coeruleoviolacea TaxID=334858 RepID=A0AAE3GBZ1_9PSEU|nr:precorrin-6y C5,15-methyltransferase (decarboxylating) subunit CbiE [Goodfellowiella coeruleoviolacea]MCP2163363.1 precorrin-6Y C5,15-methyltransferase (decarboxylating) [Goodfellowiella coeruleoviolacea]
MTIVVVGVGADGWAGLAEPARAALAGCDVLFGGRRHLDLVPLDVDKVAWPSPLLPALDELFAAHDGRRIGVLASGDPLLSGIGTTLVHRYGVDRVRVLPGVSSVALARARLGWSAETTEVVSVVGRSVHRISRVLAPGARVLVLGADADSPAAVAALLTARGYGQSRLTVLEQLAGPAERRVAGLAHAWSHPPGDPLAVIAVECVGSPALPTLPGLPDDVFEHDGQLTRRELRAAALARLAPLPGQLLWDVGAGAGSVAIEWSRAHPANRAVAVERDATRAGRISRNADRLGVPELRVVTGDAPAALAGLPEPHAVFVGGGTTAPGLLDTCWAALAPGGRLVAHAVTLESEQALALAHRDRGGELIRIAVEHAAPLGRFTGWTPARTVTQWSVSK